MMTTQILIVEDQINLARFLEIELTSEGYQVNTQYDGESGLSMVQNSHPQIILLDWDLPRTSGIEMCRQLRQAGNPIPVILMTAKDSEDDRITAQNAGISDYLTKPFTIDDLLKKIRQYLG